MRIQYKRETIEELGLDMCTRVWFASSYVYKESSSNTVSKRNGKYKYV